MKKLILFLFLSTSLFCFGQGKSALKDIQSIKFYGVDYYIWNEVSHDKTRGWC